MKASEKLAALVGARPDTDVLIPTAVLFNGGGLRPRRSGPACLTYWHLGTGAANPRTCRVSSRISPSHEAPRSTGVIAPLARAYASRRVARSDQVRLETSMPAIPGYKPPVKALCVVPQGMQEGTELLIEGRSSALLPAARRSSGSSPLPVRSGDTPGQISS